MFIRVQLISGSNTMTELFSCRAGDLQRVQVQSSDCASGNGLSGGSVRCPSRVFHWDWDAESTTIWSDVSTFLSWGRGEKVSMRGLRLRADQLGAFSECFAQEHFGYDLGSGLA
jgi:hypothetical protein